MSALLSACAPQGAGGGNDFGKEVRWDKHSLIIDGRRVVSAMGEVHFSRIPETEWAGEIEKMKEGGITVIAAYVFWNHHEEREGEFVWTGRRDLRRFVQLCKDAGMPVVLRLGPFCHGEVRCGGIPDWVFEKGIKTRREDSAFLAVSKRLYNEIYKQIEGLQWKDGGPIMAAQFDNEYRGHGSYLMALKKIATEAGFDLPFYTRTGWPELRTPVPFGEMIPLYGDYADGFWDRDTAQGIGNYYKAFSFRAHRASTAIATEQLGQQSEGDNEGGYPYFTCELGGGMAKAYHRRPFMYPQDAYSMAIVKLGSGSNLLGYYMYHGGSNPEPFGQFPLNERQKTAATNYNDMPEVNYDFQAPIGEFGQRNPHFYTLRKLHLFMQDFGETLAPMEATIRQNENLPRRCPDELRWAYRNNAEGQAFVFVNNYERFANLPARENVRFTVPAEKGDSLTFPEQPITVPAGASFFFPVNVAGLRYATAQPVAMRNGKLYLQKIEGIPAEIALTDGTIIKDAAPQGTEKPMSGNIYLLNEEQANTLFLNKAERWTVASEIAVPEPEPAQKTGRAIRIGAQRVAEMPTDSDYVDFAYTYVINIGEAIAKAQNTGTNSQKLLLSIDYAGDCARLYDEGCRLIADHFAYGEPMLYGLWRLPKDCNKLTLMILPQVPGAPIYMPAEAKRHEDAPRVDAIKILASND